MSWRKVKLAEVIKHRKSSIVIKDEVKYKLCRVQLHRRGIVLRETVKGHTIKTKKQQVCKAGDFLVAEMDAKFGGYGFVPEELDGAIVSSHYFLFELDENKIRPKFLEVISQLQILQEQIKAIGSTNYSAIRPNNVLNWEIPFVDIIEQIKIEKLFDQLKEKGETLIFEQSHQLGLIKKIRQQILKDGMHGKLVSQNSNDEPASKLLEKIKAEKAKSGKQEKLLPQIMTEEIPYKIPEGWTWCRVGTIVHFLNGYAFKSNWFKSKGIPLLRNINLGINEIVWNDITYLPAERVDEFPNYLLNEGDIVLSLDRPIINAGLKIAQIKEKDIPCLLLQRVLKISPVLLNKDYLYHWFCSNFFLENINPGRSIGIPHISHNDVSKILFPLPPLSEQQRIVSKIKELMSFCDELEASIKANQEFTNLLYQTALKEALQPKSTEEKQEDISTIIKLSTEYEKGKVIEFPKLPEKEDSHFVKRKVLATYIINQSLNDRQFGDVKFEKLLHLSDYFAIKRNLGQNYYQHAAGPYDNAFTHQYFQQALNSKWFNRSKKGNQFTFSIGQNHSKSTNTYGYFSEDELTRVNEIIGYFKNYDYEQPEIVSTLYAVWNNRIILNHEILDDLLIADFYDWDEQKKKYDRKRLERALQWMRDKNFVPDGWGKVIEKPKTKKKN